MFDLYEQVEIPDIGINTPEAISPNGRYLLTETQIWDISTWTPVATPPIKGLFTPDSASLVTFDGRRLVIYDASSGAQIDTLDLSELLDVDLSQFFYEDMRLAGISDDGRWCLLVLATSAALIPLN